MDVTQAFKQTNYQRNAYSLGISFLWPLENTTESRFMILFLKRQSN
jgi:hypothetical protein